MKIANYGRYILFSAALGILALGGPFTVSAPAAISDDYGEYTDWDYNSDGRLEESEMSNYTYDWADDNNDDRLDSNEWNAYTGAWYEPYGVEHDAFSYYDTDSDGYLENGEFITSFNETGFYNRWDKNHDGYVDNSEWDTGVNIYNNYHPENTDPAPE